MHPPTTVSLSSPEESEVEIAVVGEPNERIFSGFRGGGMHVSERTNLSEILKLQPITNKGGSSSSSGPEDLLSDKKLMKV